MLLVAVSGYPQQLPATFLAAGAAYNPFSHPGAAGWFSYARLVDAGSGTYFFTTEDLTSSRERPYTAQISVRVGIGTLLKQIGPVRVIGIVDGGAAAAGDESGGAASGGSMAIVRVLKTNYSLVIGFRVLKTSIGSGTPKVYEIGLGRAFN